MKKKELLELWDVLTSNKIKQLKEEASTKFKYALGKNTRLIQPEVEALQDLIKGISILPENIEKYNLERENLCSKFANKDDKEQPIIIGKTYQIPLDKKTSFNEELSKLKEKYSEDLDQLEKRRNELKDILEEEIDIAFYKIKLSCFPKKISEGDMLVLFPLIEDDTDENE